MSQSPTAVENSSELQIGLGRYYAMALGAFLIWGFFPIFFKELSHIDALETLAHRLLWSTVIVIVYLSLQATFHWPKIKHLILTQSGWLFLTAMFISINWGIYLYSVNTNRVLDASLGYFINPLLNIVIGLLFFRERLSRVQWIALALAIAGAINEIIRLGSLPWVSLGMAFSFAIYAGLRKKINVDATYGFLVETLLAAPLSIGYLLYLYLGPKGIEHLQPLDPLLFILCGLFTLIPLTWFTQAARFVPLSSLGLFQYLAPSILFLLGVLLYKEPIDIERLLSFSFIWAGLALVVLSHSMKQFKRKR
jgi:chloramphenicol-sensitive protein RarD